MKKILAVILLISIVTASGFAVSAEDAKKLGRPSVAVVLSGGETRGFGHVVLLEKLEELGIPIDAVYGSSSGALVGGLYCAGYTPKEIRDILTNISILSDIFDLNENLYKTPAKAMDEKTFNFLSIDKTENGIINVSGLLTNRKLVEKLNELLSGIPDNINFDDLPTRFRCTSTYSINSNLYIAEGGSLIQTISTAAAMPLLFTPVYKDGSIFSDGGFSNNLPADLAKNDGYDIVITENMNYAIRPDENSLSSISSAIGAILRIIVDREVSTMDEYSDVYITPDYSTFGSLKFTTEDAIFDIASVAIEQKMGELKEIANRFEDGRYVKDPNREGEYSKRFAKDKGKYEYELVDWRKKSEEFSVVSASVNGFVKVGFDSSNNWSFFRAPSASVRYYSTNLGVTKFGLDLAASWDNGFNLNFALPYLLSENLYVVPKGSVSYGNSYGKLSFGVSLQFTDREKFDFNAGLNFSSLSGLLVEGTAIVTDELDSADFRPEKYCAEFACFANPQSFSSCYDVSAAACAGLFNSNNLSVFADIAARSYKGLSLSSLQFGGQYMPQLSTEVLSNFVSAGVCGRYVFVESLANVYAEFNSRGPSTKVVGNRKIRETKK